MCNQATSHNIFFGFPMTFLFRKNRMLSGKKKKKNHSVLKKRK